MKNKYLLKIAFCFFLISGISYGQDILTFEFSALAGDEASASSNTNNANLSASTISRGAGLTASGNSGRFNATSWALTSIANAVSGNDYMEFTITPNATFQFSVSSISINLQRSGSGPSAVALRSSVDNYATDLDGEKAITDGTSTQSFTFTFAQANSTTAVTYRFYMFAEQTTGSGGIGDGAGNDIVVNGTVTSASSDPVVGFNAAASAETETDITFNTSIPVTISNYAAPVSVSVTVIGGTAESGDYTLNTASIDFIANGTQNISLDINDDADSDNETVILQIAVTSGTATLSTSQHTVTITDDDLPQIIITEIMYNSTGTDDEWVELYNDNGSDVDVSGWTLEYNSKTFTFPASTTFTNNSYIVVGLGSNGDGLFNNENPFTPDFNALSVANIDLKDTNNSDELGNTSGTIVLKNGVSIIDSVTYTDSDNSSTDGNGASFEIIDVTANNALTNANWQASAINGGSPKRVSGSIWTGTSDTDWTTTGNWTNGRIPVTLSDVLIPSSLVNYPTVTSATTVNAIQLNSGATLIAQDAFTGNVTYKRNLPTLDSWYLVSSPVAGETIEDLIANHTFLTGTPPNIGFSTFNNTGAAWTYASNALTGNVVNGKGYSVRLVSAGDISFTGTANTADVTFALTQGTNNYNLVGNPFTSYINSTTFLTNEAANVELTFWMWNGTGYDTRTTGTFPNFKIAPGQAFFVEAKTTNNVTFTEALQSHETTDTFQKSANNRSEIKLILADATQSRKLKVFYIDGTTKGYDNGFDGKMFGGVADSFSIYSELLSENVGVKYAIQSLPYSDFETMVIPVGIKAAAGKEITFTADAMNLQEGLKVFLEDKVTNTITRLDETNATYKVTLADALDGIGRFYLHTKASSVLGTETIALNNVSVYSLDASTLRVAGLSEGKASVKIFSILGKQVFETSFNATGVKDMQLPKLANGIYVVQLATEKGTLNKKITL